MRIVLRLLIAGIVIVAVVVNAVWLAFVFLGLVCRFLWRSRKAQPAVVVLFLASTVTVLAYAGVFPDPDQRIGVTTSRITPLASVPASHVAAALPSSADPQRDFAETWKARIFLVRKHLEDVSRAVELPFVAGEVTDRLRGKPDRADEVKAITDAREDLAQALSERQLDSPEAFDRFGSDLEKYLDEQETRLSTLDPAMQTSFAKEFSIRVQSGGAEAISGRVASLEGLLARSFGELMDSSMVVASPLGFVELDEAMGSLQLDEVIGITVKPGRVLSLDGSELLASARSQFGNATLLIGHGASPPVVAPDPAAIPIAPHAVELKLTIRAIQTGRLTPLPSVLRRFAYHELQLRWPPPLPGRRLAAKLDLTADKGPREFVHAVELKDDFRIAEIRIPEDSCLDSFPDLDRTAEGDFDVLTSSGEQLDAQFFLAHDHAWIELLPQGSVFRNDLVQSHVIPWLFPESLVAALLLWLCGQLIAGWFSRNSKSSS